MGISTKLTITLALVSIGLFINLIYFGVLMSRSQGLSAHQKTILFSMNATLLIICVGAFSIEFYEKMIEKEEKKKNQEMLSSQPYHPQSQMM